MTKYDLRNNIEELLFSYYKDLPPAKRPDFINIYYYHKDENDKSHGEIDFVSPNLEKTLKLNLSRKDYL